MNWMFQTPEELQTFGETLGKIAEAGWCITLDGDLGAGKTTMTQGLAKGLGVQDIVTSPTFTIVQQYEDGRLPLYHMDVYRIKHIDELYDIGFDEYVYGEGITVIEWADLILAALPEEFLEIRISVVPTGRQVEAIAHGAVYDALLKELASCAF